jgi:hypothetical protein
MLLHGTITRVELEEGAGYIRPDGGGPEIRFEIFDCCTLKLVGGGAVQFETKCRRPTLKEPIVGDRVVYRHFTSGVGFRASPWGYSSALEELATGSWIPPGNVI